MIETNSISTETSTATVTNYWVTDEQAAQLFGVSSTRTARHRLRNCQKKKQASTGGRPRYLYYIGSHPELSSKVATLSAPEKPKSERSQNKKLMPDDIAIATLRRQAVREYLHLRVLYNEEKAALLTVAEWTAKPRSRKVLITERSGHKSIRRDVEVVVGNFSLRTLREWAKLYLDHQGDASTEIEALAPSRKGRVGRRRKDDLNEELLNLIHALAVATPRADLEKAIALAKTKWPGEWPDVSYTTILRRLRERDPERFCDTLGKRGISDFRKEHAPDIEFDYSNMGYNDLFQIDDITQDFYGFASDLKTLIRPYVYAVIRVSTRQWICAVACETPITQNQVRALVGFCLSSPSGGIPKVFKFEHGAVACDEYLEEQLTTLGIKVSRTSMDGGKVHPDFLGDRARGHFQGKGVIESNIRGMHNHNWALPSQVGPEERHTAQSRLETLKSEASRLAKDGEFLILPSPHEWQAIIFNALEKHNNTPHSGLREIVHRVDGERHMTPNESAQHLKDDHVDVMPEVLLPLFFQKGVRVPVTKNGFILNNQSYGRFDDDLQAFAGKSVLAYGIDAMPDAAYVVELGRCVERFKKTDYGEAAPIDRKRAIEGKKRNKYEALISSALQSAGTEIAEIIRFTTNPTPNRRVDVVCPESMRNRVAEIDAATSRRREAKQASAARFDLNAEQPARRGRKSLIRDAAEIQEHVNVFSQPDIQEDKFEL